MLHRMWVYLAVKVAGWYLHKSTVKLTDVMQWYSISFCLQTGLLQYESGWQIWYNSNFSMHTYPSQCGSQLFVLAEISSRMAYSSPHSSSSISTLGSTRGGFAGILIYQSVSALFHFGETIALGIQGWMHSAICESFKRVMSFLFLF